MFSDLIKDLKHKRSDDQFEEIIYMASHLWQLLELEEDAAVFRDARIR